MRRGLPVPIAAANIQSQDFRFSVATARGTWRWVTRMDVSGLAPVFLVCEVLTPTGLLRDTIPIPGDVIEAMSDSITQLRDNFQPHILIGPPTSLTFTVDEGRGFSPPQAVILTNNGIYGSLLAATLTTSASYVTTTPGAVGNLASNETGQFVVAVDSTNLVAVDSPYTETVTVHDVRAGNTPQTLPVTINVRPKATIARSPGQLNFSVAKPFPGTFPPIPSQQFTLSNTGPSGSVLDYQIQRLTDTSNDWLVSYAPLSGLVAGGSSQLITVAVAPIESLSCGIYQETLRISGYSTNSFVDVVVQLTIMGGS